VSPVHTHRQGDTHASAYTVSPPTHPSTHPPTHPHPHPNGNSNFCAKVGLTRTAEAFESEWYELKATGRLGGLATSMTDVYLRNGELEEEVAALRHELVAAQEVAARASATWDK